MINELPIHQPDFNQHSSNHYTYSVAPYSQGSELQIHQLDTTKNEDKQDLLYGHTVNNVSPDQSNINYFSKLENFELRSILEEMQLNYHHKESKLIEGFYYNDCEYIRAPLINRHSHRIKADPLSQNLQKDSSDTVFRFLKAILIGIECYHQYGAQEHIWKNINLSNKVISEARVF